MQTITVSRNDEIYEAFADVAQAADGTLVCTYAPTARAWDTVRAPFLA